VPRARDVAGHVEQLADVRRRPDPAWTRYRDEEHEGVSGES
jgi:hypothetical protein